MSRRRLLQGAALLAVGILILVGLLRGVDPAAVATALRQASPAWIGGGILLTAGFIVVRAIRWKIILDAGGPHQDLADVVAITAVGFAINAAVPFKIGEVVRIAAVARRRRIGLVEAGATVVLERVLDVLALVLLAIGAATVSGAGSEGGGLWTGVAAFALVSLAAGAGATWLVTDPDRSLRWWSQLVLRLPGRVRPGASSLGASVLRGFSALRSRRRLLLTALLSLAAWLLSVAGLWAFFRAVSPQLPAATLFLAFALFTISQAISVTPGSVGTFEGFFLLVLSGFGAGPQAVVTAAAVVSHAGGVAVLLGLGAAGGLWLRLHPAAPPVRFERALAGQDRA